MASPLLLPGLAHEEHVHTPCMHSRKEWWRTAGHCPFWQCLSSAINTVDWCLEQVALALATTCRRNPPTWYWAMTVTLHASWRSCWACST